MVLHLSGPVLASFHLHSLEPNFWHQCHDAVDRRPSNLTVKFEQPHSISPRPLSALASSASSSNQEDTDNSLHDRNSKLCRDIAKHETRSSMPMTFFTGLQSLPHSFSPSSSPRLWSPLSLLEAFACNRSRGASRSLYRCAAFQVQANCFHSLHRGAVLHWCVGYPPS